MTLVLGFGPGGPARAQEPPSLSPRGGSLAKTGRHRFEVFFYKTGVRIYPRDAAEAPVATSPLTGTATFVLPGAATPFVYPLKGAVAGNGPAPGSLDLAVDLGRVPATGTQVTFRIEGLADPAEPVATFTVPFRLTANASPRVAVVPATLTITRSTPADQAAINAQRVCKVSGEPLGSMGAPIKVTRGDRMVFLCCQGCVRRVQANSDQYLGAAR
jgi:hypothetical protein